jgi:hypothetical protein
MDRKPSLASNGGSSSPGSSKDSAVQAPASSSFRRILPAFAAAAPAPRSLADGGRPILPGSGSSIRSTVPPKNVHVKAACDACRKRKVKVCQCLCC